MGWRLWKGWSGYSMDGGDCRGGRTWSREKEGKQVQATLSRHRKQSQIWELLVLVVELARVTFWWCVTGLLLCLIPPTLSIIAFWDLPLTQSMFMFFYLISPYAGTASFGICCHVFICASQHEVDIDWDLTMCYIWQRKGLRLQSSSESDRKVKAKRSPWMSLPPSHHHSLVFLQAAAADISFSQDVLLSLHLAEWRPSMFLGRDVYVPARDCSIWGASCLMLAGDMSGNQFFFSYQQWRGHELVRNHLESCILSAAAAGKCSKWEEVMKSCPACPRQIYCSASHYGSTLLLLQHCLCCYFLALEMLLSVSCRIPGNYLNSNTVQGRFAQHSAVACRDIWASSRQTGMGTRGSRAILVLFSTKQADYPCWEH